MLGCQVITILGSVGSAVARDFPTLIGTRALNGVGIAALMALGPTCVNDMFFLHERGFKTGVYTIFITNGAHVAVLCMHPMMPDPYPAFVQTSPLHVCMAPC